MRQGRKFDPHLRTLLQQTKYNSLGFFFVSFIIPVIAYLDFGANGYEMGLLFSLQMVGVAISTPIVGRVADQRHLRSMLIFAGSIGRMLSYMLSYVAILGKIYWLLGAGTFTLGCGGDFSGFHSAPS